MNNNELVEYAVSYVVNRPGVKELPGDITLVSSVAFTLKNSRVEISFEPFSDEDIAITNQVNDRLREINLARSNGKTM